MVYGGSSKATLKTFQTLEADLQKIHSSKYSYDRAVFVNARTPMVITCSVHGDFLQRPRDHKRGQGCRKCFENSNAINRTKSIEVLKAELSSVSRFTYPELVFDKDIKAQLNKWWHNRSIPASRDGLNYILHTYESLILDLQHSILC